MPDNSLGQSPVPKTGKECVQSCCRQKGCAGVVFARSGYRPAPCNRNEPCCFMKSSVAYPVPSSHARRMELWVLPGRGGVRADEEGPPLDITTEQQRAEERALDQEVVNVYTKDDARIASFLSKHVVASDEARIASFLKRYSCQHVYLDVGTNVGIQIRKLFQPSLYPNAKIRPHFDAAYGPSPRCGICAIGFEPNVRHTTRLNQLEHKLDSLGFGAMIFHAAAGATDGFVRLQFGSQRSRFEDAGASALGGAAAGAGSCNALIINSASSGSNSSSFSASRMFAAFIVSRILGVSSSSS